jgi:hypothetical protein
LGSKIFDLISANIAAITKYSAANSKLKFFISVIYSMYWAVIWAMGISNILILSFLIKYSKRSKGPVNTPRNTLSALDGT